MKLFNKAVFKQAVKSNWVLFATFTGIMALLLAQFGGIKDISKLLPAVYHGLMFMIIPSIYVLITSSKLLCSQVDSGSLAYTLATKVKREAIIFTQIAFLVGSLFIMFALLTVVNLGVNAVNEVYTVGQIFALNASGFAAMCAFAGICYMFSCIFNLAKKNMGVTGGLTLVFILGSMLGMFAQMGMEALKFFKYITIFSLYMPDSVGSLIPSMVGSTTVINEGTNTWIIGMLILFVISAVTFTIGLLTFRKKDLPL